MVETIIVKLPYTFFYCVDSSYIFILTKKIFKKQNVFLGIYVLDTSHSMGYVSKDRSWSYPIVGADSIGANNEN